MNGAGDTLGQLAAIEGFSGAALFTAEGELLAALGGDGQLEKAGHLASSMLVSAHEASTGMGTGRGRQVHIAGDRAHVLVRCLDEAADATEPQRGRVHLHLVVVLTSEASVGLAKVRMTAALQELASRYRA
jgi:predicted regulator of Ras-like GTPase activity (Roadblock/LC7/MglB family)